MDDQELTPCYQAYSLMEAKFIADQLNAAGIKAVSDDQDMQDFVGAWDGNPRVYVRAVDMERARKWLADYEARKHEDEKKGSS